MKKITKMLFLLCFALPVLTAHAQDLTQQRGETTINSGIDQTGINYLSDDAMQNIDGGKITDLYINGRYIQGPSKKEIENALDSAVSKIGARFSRPGFKLIRTSKEGSAQWNKGVSLIKLTFDRAVDLLDTKVSKQAYKLVIGDGPNNNYFVPVNPGKGGKPGTEVTGATRNFFTK